MSLDVYLTIPGANIQKPQSSGIFVRDGGATKEIGEAEWRSKNPDREPVRFISEEVTTDQVFHANITHNLNRMATAAGIYDALWRPDEVGIKKARELLAILVVGLEKLLDDPELYKKHNPDNGWGTYDQLVLFVKNYLKACIDYPQADVSVDR